MFAPDANTQSQQAGSTARQPDPFAHHPGRMGLPLSAASFSASPGASFAEHQSASIWCNQLSSFSHQPSAALGTTALQPVTAAALENGFPTQCLHTFPPHPTDATPLQLCPQSTSPLVECSQRSRPYDPAANHVGQGVAFEHESSMRPTAASAYSDAAVTQQPASQLAGNLSDTPSSCSQPGIMGSGDWSLSSDGGAGLRVQRAGHQAQPTLVRPSIRTGGLAGSLPLALLQMGAPPGCISDLTRTSTPDDSTQIHGQPASLARHSSMNASSAFSALNGFQPLPATLSHMRSKNSLSQPAVGPTAPAALPQAMNGAKAGGRSVAAVSHTEIIGSAGLKQEACGSQPVVVDGSFADEGGHQQRDRGHVRVMHEAQLADLGLLALQVTLAHPEA